MPDKKLLLPDKRPVNSREWVGLDEALKLGFNHIILWQWRTYGCPVLGRPIHFKLVQCDGKGRPKPFYARSDIETLLKVATSSGTYSDADGTWLDAKRAWQQFGSSRSQLMH